MSMQMAFSLHSTTTTPILSSTHCCFHPLASRIGRERSIHTRRPHPPPRHIQVQGRALAVRCADRITWSSSKRSRLFPPMPKEIDFKLPSSSLPMRVDSEVNVVVGRPKKSRSREEKDDEEEVLVIEGVELERDVAVQFDVYINLEEDENRAGPEVSEYVGSFVHVPHDHGKREELMKTSLTLKITDALEDLGADDDDEVLVTIVPRRGMGVASVGGLRIAFIS